MSRQNLAWLLGIFAVSLFGFTVSLNAKSRTEDLDYEYVKLFVDVLHEVRSRYVQELTPERERKLVEDMLNGGLDRLDEHSAFINPREFKQFNRQSRGKFGGVGIHIGADTANHGHLTVISPMPGTPAYEAGILAGDTILKIDGKSTESMRLDEAIDLITGEPGEKVTLSLRHETGEQKDVTLVRAEIAVPSVMGDRRQRDNVEKWDWFVDRASKIGYVRLTGFNETASAELREVVEEMKKEGVRGLVLDLRSNPGGLLRSAREVSNLFLSDGRIVSTRGRNHAEEVFSADPKETVLGPDSKVPMAVLVNRYSASASEIVAAALQDHHRAVVVGERSYGKGSVQNILQMERNQSALKLTTASYWRPSGKNIHRFPDSKDEDEWGVKPDKDFEVKLTTEERVRYVRWRTERDVVRKSDAPKKKDAKDAEFKDKVLEKALEHLRKEIKKVALDLPLESHPA